MIKAIIFDFNGTLFFDTPLHNIAWGKMVKEITGEELNEETRTRIHGSNNADIIYNLNPTLTQEESKNFSLQKEAMYRSICLAHPEKLHLVDGAITLFEYLKENQIPFNIASASIKENIDFFFETFSLGDYFDRSEVFYDNGNYPTKVEMFQATVDRLGLKASECLIFEDSKTGITCAKTIGAGYIVGVGEDTKTLLEYGADECITDYTKFNYDLLK